MKILAGPIRLLPEPEIDIAVDLSKRKFLKGSVATAGVLVIAAPGVLLQTACGDTKQLAAWTSTVISVLRDVSPILTEMGAFGIVASITAAIPIAERLKKAFQDNDNASAFQFLDNLINPQTGIIVEIATAVGALVNDGRKRIVLGLLAIGQVALRLISAQIENEVPPSAIAAARAARPSAADAVQRAASADVLEKAFSVSRF